MGLTGHPVAPMMPRLATASRNVVRPLRSHAARSGSTTGLSSMARPSPHGRLDGAPWGCLYLPRGSVRCNLRCRPQHHAREPDHRTRRGRRPFCGPSEAKLARTNTASPGNTSTPPVCSAFLRSSPVIASVVGKPTVLRLWATSSNSPRVTIPPLPWHQCRRTRGPSRSSLHLRISRC